MATTSFLLSNLLVIAALTGACSPSFQADLPEVEVTQRGLKVAAAPAGLAATSGAGTFTLSAAAAPAAKRMNSNVLVHRVEIVAGGSLTNLDFVEFVRMTVVADGLPETTTEIMAYERAEVPSSGSIIEVDMPIPVDITNPWSADKTVVGFQVAGQLPVQDWTFDVALSLSGKITYAF